MLALTGTHISQLHIVLCIILYLLFAVKVFLKTNAYELCVLYYKYGVSWRRYRDQDKFNLTVLSEVTSTSFQSATCNKQAKLVVYAEEKSWRDSVLNITVGRYRKACFMRSIRCTARLHFPKKIINSISEIMPPPFWLFIYCLIPLTGVRFKMIPFSLFQWDSMSHKGEINSKWELCILQHLYTIILPSSPLYACPSVINNGANLQRVQCDSSSTYSAPRLAEQFYLVAGNRRLLESFYQFSIGGLEVEPCSTSK